MRRIRNFITVCVLSLSFLVMVGTSGADPRPGDCSSDCGVHPDDTPADVMANIRQQQKDTGNYLYINRPY